MEPSDVVERIRARLASEHPERRVRDSRGVSRRRRRSAAVVGAALGIGALVVGGLVVTVGGMSDGVPSPASMPRPSTPGATVPAVTDPDPDPAAPTASTAGATSVPSPGSAVAQQVLPAGFRCRSAPALRAVTPSAGAVLGLVCASGDPRLRVEIRVADPASTRARFAALVAGVPTVVQPPCIGVERPWSRARRPDVVAGVVRCGRSRAGVEVVWSVDALGAVVRAVRSDADLAVLVRWWDAASPRGDT